VSNVNKAIDILLGQPKVITAPDIQKRPINTILTVDDSTAMRRIISNILTSIGIENVIEAKDGVQALQKLEEHAVDMVMVDWNMPRMNGLEFVKQARKNPQLKNVSIVLVTAEGYDNIVQVLKAGANDYVNKPVNVHGIKNLVFTFTSNLQYTSV